MYFYNFQITRVSVCLWIQAISILLTKTESWMLKILFLLANLLLYDSGCCCQFHYHAAESLCCCSEALFFAGMIEKNQDSIIYDYVQYRFPYFTVFKSVSVRKFTTRTAQICLRSLKVNTGRESFVLGQSYPASVAETLLVRLLVTLQLVAAINEQAATACVLCCISEYKAFGYRSCLAEQSIWGLVRRRSDIFPVNRVHLGKASVFKSTPEYDYCVYTCPLTLRGEIILKCTGCECSLTQQLHSRCT